MPGISSVSICSNALLLLGDRPIDSFDEDNDRTRLVANLYQMKRDKVLRAHPWNCAVRREILSPMEQGPKFGWKYQFVIPDDCLRILSVGDEDQADDYNIEGRTLLMNVPVCMLRYIWRNTVEATWDSMLVDGMTQVMVAALTYPITKSTTKQQTEEQIIRDVLKAARAVDGQENPPQTLGDFPLLANRMR